MAQVEGSGTPAIAALASMPFRTISNARSIQPHPAKRPGATAIKRVLFLRSCLIVPAINNNGNMRILLRG
jgi:hypothetical protein